VRSLAGTQTLLNVPPFSDYTEVGGRFVCARCSKYYKHRGTILRHLKYECGKEPRYQCSLCAFKCKRYDHLYTHMNSKKHKMAAVR
jgi:hypothetical protein